MNKWKNMLFSADKGPDSDAVEGAFETPPDQQGIIEDLLADDLIPAEEEAVKEEVVEEKPEEEKPEEVKEEEKPEPKPEEEPEVEEPEVKEEEKEKPSEEEEEDEITDESPEQAILDTNEKLRDQIIAMAEQGYGVQSPDDVEEEKPDAGVTHSEEETEKPEPIKLEELKIEDFLNEDELDRVNDHPELLNTAFTRFVTTFKDYIESTMGVIAPLQQEVRALPQQVSKAVGSQLDFNTFVNDFYTENPELTKASKVVYMTYRNLLTDAQEAGKKTTIGELYSAAGDEVRDMLSIPKAAAKPGKREPALPGAKTPKREQRTPSGKSTQADLMADLIKD